MSPKFAGFLRHLLTTLGGLAVGKGWLDEQTATAAVGVGMSLVGFAWSLAAPEKTGG